MAAAAAGAPDLEPLASGGGGIELDPEAGEPTILEDTFGLFPRTSDVYAVRLTPCHFEFSPTSRSSGSSCKSVALADVVGCICMRRKADTTVPVAAPSLRNGDGDVPLKEATLDPGKSLEKSKRETTAAFFGVYCYPLKRRKVGRGAMRKRTVLAFRVDKFPTYEENLVLADKWRRAVLGQLWVPKPNFPIAEFLESKKLLVLINPASGQGKAKDIFVQRVRPVLAEAGVTYEVVITERQNHAMDIVSNPETLDACSGIVIVSGDGLIHEVYNGLFLQKDWKRAVKFPVGVVPGGSGNALAKCVSFHAKEPYEDNPILISTLNLVWHTILPMDLMLVQSASRTYCSFLSVGYGLFADIDIESEKLRVLGETRFTVWAVARLANLRTYNCRISFDPSPPDEVYGKMATSGGAPPERIEKAPRAARHLSGAPSLPSPAEEKPGDAGGMLGPPPNRLAHSLSYAGSEPDPGGSKIRSRLLAEASFEEADEVFERAGAGDNQQLKSEAVNETGEHAALVTKGEQKESADVNCNYPERLTIPPLDQPVPDHWHVIEGDMVVVYAVVQSYINSDSMIAPRAKLDDGNIWLMFVRAGIPKAQLFKMMVSLEDGAYLKSPHVTQIPVRAFRIEPTKNNGYMTIDGENVPVGPIQAEILPSAARVISR